MFDPALLEQVIVELWGELKPTVARDPRLKDIDRTLVLCDGTLLRALPRLAEAMWKHSRTGNPMYGWRMHCQFELDRHAPSDVALTPYRCQGDEQTVLKAKLKPGCCYVYDRGYFDYSLFNAVVDAGSDYVGRVKKSIAFDVVEERALTPAARAAGVVRDALVTAGSSPWQRYGVSATSPGTWRSSSNWQCIRQAYILLPVRLCFHIASASRGNARSSVPSHSTSVRSMSFSRGSRRACGFNSPKSSTITCSSSAGSNTRLASERLDRLNAGHPSSRRTFLSVEASWIARNDAIAGEKQCSSTSAAYWS